MASIKQFLKDRRGVTAIEYGLLIAVISALVLSGISLVGTNMSKEFSTISTYL